MILLPFLRCVHVAMFCFVQGRYKSLSCITQNLLTTMHLITSDLDPSSHHPNPTPSSLHPHFPHHSLSALNHRNAFVDSADASLSALPLPNGTTMTSRAAATAETSASAVEAVGEVAALLSFAGSLERVGARRGRKVAVCCWGSEGILEGFELSYVCVGVDIWVGFVRFLGFE